MLKDKMRVKMKIIYKIIIIIIISHDIWNNTFTKDINYTLCMRFRICVMKSTYLHFFLINVEKKYWVGVQSMIKTKNCWKRAFSRVTRFSFFLSFFFKCILQNFNTSYDMLPICGYEKKKNAEILLPVDCNYWNKIYTLESTFQSEVNLNIIYV